MLTFIAPPPRRRLLHRPRRVVHRLHADGERRRPAGVHRRDLQPDAAPGRSSTSVIERAEPRRATRCRATSCGWATCCSGDFGISARTQLPVIDELDGPRAADAQAGRRPPTHPVDPGRHRRSASSRRCGSTPGFDYIITFFTFVFFSLPVFWVAVILKDFGGINFNDWLRDGAHFAAVVHRRSSALVAAIIVYSFAGGTRRRGGSASPSSSAPRSAGIVTYISATQWMLDPGFGPVVLALFAAGIAFGVTAVMAGVRNRKAFVQRAHHGRHRRRAVVPAADAVRQRRHEHLVDCSALAVVADRRRRRRRLRVGWLRQGPVGAHRRGHRARWSASSIFVDRTMQSWAEYSANPVIRNRPIKTIGDQRGRASRAASG